METFFMLDWVFSPYPGFHAVFPVNKCHKVLIHLKETESLLILPVSVGWIASEILRRIYFNKEY